MSMYMYTYIHYGAFVTKLAFGPGRDYTSAFEHAALNVSRLVCCSCRPTWSKDGQDFSETWDCLWTHTCCRLEACCKEKDLAKRSMAHDKEPRLRCTFRTHQAGD